MGDRPTERLTRVLSETAAGDPRAASELLPLVYQELRRLASARLGQLPPGQTLEPTALVHEAYLRVASDTDGCWDSRSHFFAAAARSMRNILVDGARRKACIKHGGDRQRQDLDPYLGMVQPPDDNVLAVHEALDVLAEHDPDKAEIVLLRYFIGLSNRETADLLGISLTTVERRWRFLRAWLRQFIAGDRPKIDSTAQEHPLDE